VPATRWELFRSEVGGQIFVPFAQGFQGDVFFQVRAASNTVADDPAFLSFLRQEVHSAAPGVPVFSVRTFRQHLDADPQLWVVRSAAALVSIFAGLALILAIVGVYGVVAYAVVRRTREIGIRMALGSERGGVLRLILRQGLVMALAGAALGFLFALGAARLFSGVLFQVSPLDPFAFTIAPAVILATALLASYLPARRASKVDPMVALRYE
jgi:ABC-type antimicrobial peptide transport system permease subunit